MPPHILILSTGHLSDNPRVLKEASTLGDAGYKVTVVGKRSLSLYDNTEKKILNQAPFNHIKIDMIGSNKLSTSSIWGLYYRSKISLARKLLKYFGWQSAEALGSANALLKIARNTPADLTIVHNEVAQWVGVQLLKEGRQVAVDFEDWNSEDLPPSERSQRPLDLLRHNESVLLEKATYATTTSNALADGLHKRYCGQRPAVITNSFPLPFLPSWGSLNKNIPSFFWFSQTIGPGRGLEPFLAAYAQLKSPSRLTLLGQVRQSYQEHLLLLLPENLRSQVNFHPLVSPDELPLVIAQHDIGLALEQCQPLNRDLTITNKILQYLGGGLALAATPTRGQLEVLAHSPRAGVLLNQLNNPQQTAATLEPLLSNPSELRQCKQAARRLAETRYNWEHEAPRLLGLVERAIGKGNR